MLLNRLKSVYLLGRIHSFTKQRAIQCYSEGRLEKNVRKYVEAIKSLMNGTKITQKSIAKEMGMSERQLRRIRSDESYQEFFMLQKKLIKEYNTSLKKIEVDDDVLDLGREILEKNINILKPDPISKKDENFSLTDDQKNRIFDRIYSDILRRNENYGKERLLQLFYNNLEEFEPMERKILSIEPDSIDDSETFWKQERLERMLLPLYLEVNPKIK